MDPEVMVPFFLTCVAVGYVIVRLLKQHLTKRTQRTVFWLFGLWLVSVCFRAHTGWYFEGHGFPPRMLLAIGPPTLVLLWLAWSRKASNFASQFSQNFLIGFQGFRVVVELCILALVRRGLMPEEMTFQGYNFDIIPGITALILAAFVRSDSIKWVGPIILWNVLSMATLMVTVVTGILSAPGPLQRLNTDVANRAVLMFPYVLLPALLVPAAFAFHMLSIKRARRTLQTTADLSVPPLHAT